MAFYTLVAPLITLTYPLDKIKDGQAQAFSMWIKEYLFTALIQVVHLVIYFVMVSSALSLVDGYEIYAIIVLAFIKKGEDYIKKMFGFEKAETVGTLGAAATGGLVMNAINQLKGFGGSLGAGAAGAASGAGGSGSSSGGDSGGSVRTATTNPLDFLKKGGSVPSGGSGTPSGGTAPRGGSSTSDTQSDSGGGQNTGKWDKIKRNLTLAKKGASAVRKKYTGPAAKKLAGGLLGGTGAIIGLAAGIAQGDLGAAAGGLVAGAKAGNAFGQGVANWGTSLPGNIRSSVENVMDAWNEGAFGEEGAQSIKFDREFRRGSTYKALKSKYGEGLSEESVQKLLNEGITDKSAMTSILDSKIAVDDAIKYYTVAKKCPDEIYYDDKLLKEFCEHLRKKDSSFSGKSYGEIRDLLGKFK